LAAQVTVVFWTLQPTTQKVAFGLFRRPTIAHNKFYGEPAIASGRPRPDNSPVLQEQNPMMQLDQLCLLFEADNLMASKIVAAPWSSACAPFELQMDNR